MQKVKGLRMHPRTVCNRIFYLLLNRLGICRLREHPFFGSLLARPAAVADCGAYRGEFFAALKSEYSISRPILVEANPTLADSLKQKFGSQVNVLHAALSGANNKGPITLTRSADSESSSIFREWAAAYGVADQIDIPAVEFSNVIRELGGRVDLVKLDVEGAEIGILESASASDLASCGQLTVEFHDRRPPLTRRDVDNVCRRMRAEGYGIVKPNWPNVDDVLFVNLKTTRTMKRIEYRCCVAVANALFVIRRRIFGSGYS
jgi:FkbM family methyltransferase